MRKLTFALTLSLLACTDDDEQVLPSPDAGPDAAAVDASLDAAQLDSAPALDASVDATLPDASSADAAVDAAVDASTALDASVCKPTVLLQGGADYVAQGWSAVMMAPSAVMIGQDYTELATSTLSGARTSGMFLLTYPDAVQVPFSLEVVMRVVSVQPHNLLDSAAAILGSLRGPYGNQDDRSQMLYLDSTSIGWADDTQSAAASVVDGKAHTYVLSVDAQNVARVSIDGVAKLTRSNYTTNGTIAIGDQTNDPNVDAVIQLQSVTKLCP